MKKLEDVLRKLELLYDRLRANSVSNAFGVDRYWLIAQLLLHSEQTQVFRSQQGWNVPRLSQDLTIVKIVHECLHVKHQFTIFLLYLNFMASTREYFTPFSFCDCASQALCESWILCLYYVKIQIWRTIKFEQIWCTLKFYVCK